MSVRVSNSVTDITYQIVRTLTVRFIEPLYEYHGYECLAFTAVLQNFVINNSNREAVLIRWIFE
jgi:hypothetical protein